MWSIRHLCIFFQSGWWKIEICNFFLYNLIMEVFDPLYLCCWHVKDNEKWWRGTEHCFSVYLPFTCKLYSTNGQPFWPRQFQYDTPILCCGWFSTNYLKILSETSKNWVIFGQTLDYVNFSQDKKKKKRRRAKGKEGNWDWGWTQENLWGC